MFYIACQPAPTDESTAVLISPYELIHYSHGAITYELPLRGKLIPVHFGSNMRFILIQVFSRGREEKHYYKAPLTSTVGYYTIHKASMTHNLSDETSHIILFLL